MTTPVSSNNYNWVPTTAQSNNNAADQTEQSSGMSTDAFMQLLLVELQNQNPLEPMDESQMMSQVTSLNSLQQLSSISTSLADLNQTNEIGYASSLIGKTVTVNLDDERVVTGEVTSVLQYDGKVTVRIGAVDYPLSSILMVSGE